MALIVFHYNDWVWLTLGAIVVAVAVTLAIVAVMEVVDVVVVPRKGDAVLHTPPHPTPDQPSTLFPPESHLIATPLFLHVHCAVYNMYYRPTRHVKNNPSPSHSRSHHPSWSYNSIITTNGPFCRVCV